MTATQRAIYARISDDAKKVRAGIGGRNVGEQVDDSLGYTERTWGIDPSLAVDYDTDGWETAPLVVFRENDRSAFKTAPVQITMFGETFTAPRVDRPVWRAMMREIRSGRFSDVVGLDLDRLARDPSDVEDAIGTATQHGVAWHEYTGGDLHLDTSGGQMNVRVKVMIANKSSQDTSRRVERAHQRRVEAGLPNWRMRPIGHDLVRDERGRLVGIVRNEVEAAEIRVAADRLIRGASLAEIGRSWDEKGFTTSRGGTWMGTKVYKRHTPDCAWLPESETPERECGCKGKVRAPGAGNLVGQLMRQPRLAGLLEYQGEIVGEGAFPAILEPDVWRALVASLDRRSGAGQGRQPGYAGGGARYGGLLTGEDSPARCKVCGSTLTTANLKLSARTSDEKTRVYRCMRGCVVVRQDAVDREVLHRAAVAAAEANVRLLPGGHALDVAPLKAREAELIRDMDMWRDKLRAREVSAEFALPLVNDLERELAELRRDIASADAVTVAAPEELRRVFDEWEGLDLGAQRAIIGRLYERITLDRRYDDQDHDTERIVSLFADGWLPASATPAGQEIRGVRSMLNLKTGRMVVSDWLLVG